MAVKGPIYPKCLTVPRVHTFLAWEFTWEPAISAC